MIVEMEVDNPKLELIPGMYASVVLKADERPNALAIPTEAITIGKKTVYVVNADNEVEQRTVTLGLQTPTKYEVLSGLKKGDMVLIGDASQVKPGEKVEPKLVNLLAAQ
jgi:multidrug efflux pump subunit AcrA (membrane-fusion protein)